MDCVRIARIARLVTLALGLSLAFVWLAACAAPPPPAPAATATSAPAATAVPATAAATKPPTSPTPPPSPTPAGAAQKGGALVVGLSVPSLSILDPMAETDRDSETVVRNMFDALVTRTTTNQVVMELAQSYKWVDDKTVEFTLKKGVTFHNGDPFTADDVVFTFDRVMKQDIGAPRRFATAGISSVEKVDDYTVRFNMPAAWPPLLQSLVHVPIVPKNYVQKVGDKGFAAAPVGTGPFKFVSGNLSDAVVMERYDKYYGGSADLPPVGPAFLDRVTFKVMPEASSRVAALIAGEVQIIESVPPQLVDRLKSTQGLLVQMVGGTRPKLMDMNVKKPPFDDVRVRQAFNYGTDRKTLLKVVAGDIGQLLPGPLSPQNNMADPTLQPYPFDKAKALSLLADAGWKPGADGILVKDGSKFSLVIDSYGEYVPLAEAIAGQLRSNLGVDASVRTWDYAVLQPLLLNGERQAFVRDWGDSIFDPVGYIEAKWRTTVPKTSLGRANFSLYSNAKVDQDIDSGAIEPNTEKRKAIYKDMQQIIYNDAPTVFLYVPGEIQANSTYVQNWSPSPDSRINLHRVWLKK